ncbi:Hypothetical predicted protein, partial [Cloeon dipterum]
MRSTSSRGTWIVNFNKTLRKMQQRSQIRRMVYSWCREKLHTLQGQICLLWILINLIRWTMERKGGGQLRCSEWAEKKKRKCSFCKK